MNAAEVRARLAALGERPRFDFDAHDLDEAGRHPEFGELKDAAVLIPLVEQDDGLHLVFTERSPHLTQHAGQVSFPGGRRDPGDRDLAHTALRESWEEIGLASDDVTVYGALMRMPTITGYHVTVYVGEFDHPYELVANPDEIAAIFHASLERIADETIHRVEHQQWSGRTYPVHYFDYHGHTVWGATGLMLITFLEFLGLR